MNTFHIHRNCPDCGKSINVSDSRRKRCAECWAIKRMQTPEAMLPIRFCRHCETEITLLNPMRRVCSACGQLPVRYRANYKQSINDNQISRAVTKYAVKVGFLPDPTNFICLDCKGRQAQCYDHRDYSKPLEVDPVCLRCNNSRGRGIPLHINHESTQLTTTAA
jgi:hypothetical protein